MPTTKRSSWNLFLSNASHVLYHCFKPILKIKKALHTPTCPSSLFSNVAASTQLITGFWKDLLFQNTNHVGTKMEIHDTHSHRTTTHLSISKRTKKCKLRTSWKSLCFFCFFLSYPLLLCHLNPIHSTHNTPRLSNILSIPSLSHWNTPILLMNTLWLTRHQIQSLLDVVQLWTVGVSPHFRCSITETH